MSRRRHKEKKGTEPDRGRRIADMLRNDKETRDALEETNRLAKEVRDHAHYDGLQKDRCKRISELLPSARTELEACLNKRADCVVAYSHLERQSEMLEEELRVLRGEAREVNETDSNDLPDSLTTEQINALRLFRELDRQRALRISRSDIDELSASFSSLLDKVEPKIRQLCELSNDLLLIFQKKIERGWMSAADFEPYKSELEKSTELIESITEHRGYLVEWLKECEVCLQKSSALRQTIEDSRRNNR